MVNRLKIMSYKTYNKDYVSVKGPFGVGYSGEVNNMGKVGKCALGIGLGASSLYLVANCVKRAYNCFFENKNKDADHRRKMEEMQFNHQAKMEEATHKSNLKKEEMNLEQEHWREKHAKQEVSSVDSDAGQSSVAECDEEPEVQQMWLENFQKKYPMPKLFGVLDTIINGVCPIGYESSMLLHLLCMLASMCFSKVRSKYRDGILHAPNLQVVIEGVSGGGKGKFETIYKLLFARIIEADREKLNRSEDEKGYTPIVQTAGIGLSGAKLVDVMADNQGTHTYIFSSEIYAVVLDLKKDKGLTFNHFRLAFENGDLYNNNKDKKSKKGSFPIFLNYTFTGTPADAEEFIKNQVAGGSASRISWDVIPECGREIPNLDLPSETELEKIRDQIDEWRALYCFQTVDGEDKAQAETIIDLDYVKDALEVWVNEQYDLADREKNPARASKRTRMGTMAFHYAIPIAMIYGNPSAKEHAKRKAVVELVIYIANLCMERYLHKFADCEKNQHNEAMEAEMVKSGAFETQYSEARREFTEDDVREWVRLKQEEDMSYMEIADKFKTTKDVVSGRIRRYIEKNPV